MEKLLERFKKLFDGYVLIRFEKLFPKDLIISLYKKVALINLEIDTKEVSVKKGRVRYTLLICKDKDLQTRFNLGRI